MADTVAVTTKGLGEFRRDLRRLEPLVDRELRDALREAGEKVAITAGAHAQRRTGEYAHSIRAFVSGAKVSVGSTLPQAGVLHFGGVIRPRGVPITFRPHPVILEAIEDHADELVDDIGDGVERAARRAGWH
jgi:phage gpG-like protein